MYIEGKIIAVGQRRGGQTQTGNSWEAQDFVLQTEEQYPKHVSFDVFGTERLDGMHIQQNELLRVFFEIDARQGGQDGRWFNSVRAYRVERIEPNTNIPQPAQAPQGQHAPNGMYQQQPMYQQQGYAQGGQQSPFPPAQGNGNNMPF